MPSNGKIKALEDLHDNLYLEIRGSEDWAPSYKDAPDQLNALIRSENRQLRNLKTYFLQLATDRITYWVNWGEYKSRADQTVKAAAVQVDVTITEDSPQYLAEETILLGVMIDEVKEGMLQGVLGGQAVYTRYIGTAEANKLISQEALDHSAQLVKGLNSTTLKAVQKSINESIVAGEDLPTAVERLEATIADPVRAQMIARTESVRSFGAGRMAYARKTKAATKEWVAMVGADEGSAEQPCVDNDDQGPIPLENDFISGDPFQPAHPNCRCDVIFGYGDDLEDDPESGDDEEETDDE